MTVTPSHKDSPGGGTEDDDASTAAMVDVPRYIALPDCLRKLSRRFPAVTQCVMLECVRCRQWVPVEVLQEVPSEVRTLPVRVQREREEAEAPKDEEEAKKKTTTERRALPGSLYPRSRGGVLTFSQDPMDRVHKYLSDSEQARERMFLEARRCFPWATANSSSLGGPGGGGGAAAAWHSPRLRAHQQHVHDPSKEGGRDGGTAEKPRLALVSLAEKRFGESLLNGKAGALSGSHAASSGAASPLSAFSPSPSPSSSSNAASLTGPQQPRGANRRRSSAEERVKSLFIPNPAVFCCPWQSCQQADLLLDLRNDFLGDIYTTAVEQPLIPPLPSEGIAVTANAFDRACRVSHHLWSKRHALNERLALEVQMKRSGRLAQRRCGVHAEGGEGNGGREPTSAWNLLERSGSDDVENAAEDGVNSGPTPTSSSHRLPAKLLKAAAEQLLRPRAHDSRGRMEPDDLSREHRGDAPLTHEEADAQRERRILSAFCWVTCDNCGKLRRVAQPFPGGCGAPFVCPLAAGVGSCDMPEVEGVLSVTASVLAREEELALMYYASSQLPEPLASQCEALLHGDLTEPSAEATAARQGGRRGGGGGEGKTSSPAFDDPLLQLVCTDAMRRALRYTATAFPPASETSPAPLPKPTPLRSKGGGGGAAAAAAAPSSPAARPAFGGELSPESFPLLGQLAALVRKRSLASLVRHLTLTPQEIRGKREKVLRAYLYDEKGDQGKEGEAVNYTSAAAFAVKQKEEKQEDEEEDSGGEGKHEKARVRARTGAPALESGRRGGRGSAATTTASRRSGQAGKRRGDTRRRPTSADRRRRDTNDDEEEEDDDDEDDDDDTGSGSHSGSSSSSSSSDSDDEGDVEEDEEDDEEEVVEVGKQRKRRGNGSKKSESRGASRGTRSSPSSSRPRKRAKRESKDETHTSRQSTSNAKPTKKPSSSSFSRDTATAATPTPLSGPRRGRGRPPGRSIKAAPLLESQLTQLPRRGRKRAIDRFNDASDRTASNTETEKIFWVQCDRCDRWRILSKKLPSSVQFWECKMRPNTTCADRGDDADDEAT